MIPHWQQLREAPDAKSLDSLQFLEGLEKRDGVRIENPCLAETAVRDCSPSGIQRAGRGLN